jgi:hypothetical protein
VFGEGSTDARLMPVGEQPGDREDIGSSAAERESAMADLVADLSRARDKSEL